MAGFSIEMDQGQTGGGQEAARPLGGCGCR